MSKKDDDFEKMADAIFRGSLALQATPMLRASGRTTAALTGTVEGFAGIGIAGAVSRTAFGMVKPRKRIGKKRKRKGGN